VETGRRHPKLQVALIALLAVLALAVWARPAYALSGTITANPGYVLAPAGGLASTTISWSTSDGSGAQVRVSPDGSPEKLFASGPSGSQGASWIQAGSSYTFTLWGGAGYATDLGQTVVTGVQAGTVTASPSSLTLPASGPGSTAISWWTADGSPAQVWVSVNGGPEKLFAQSASGTGSAPWIGPGTTVFNLWQGTAHSTLLDSVTVTASAPVVSVPVVSSTPTQAPLSGHPRVSAKITIAWTWSRTRTKLHKIRITGVPAKATIAVACRGNGCPDRARSASSRHLARLLRSLAGSTYRPGDRLLITITAPGLLAERAEVSIHGGALPKARLL
jgi:hypothetical protein